MLPFFIRSLFLHYTIQCLRLFLSPSPMSSLRASFAQNVIGSLKCNPLRYLSLRNFSTFPLFFLGTSSFDASLFLILLLWSSYLRFALVYCTLSFIFILNNMTSTNWWSNKPLTPSVLTVMDSHLATYLRISRYQLQPSFLQIRLLFF